MGLLQSRQVKLSGVNETSLPIIESRVCISEYRCISLLPELPRCNAEDFKEERMGKVIFSLAYGVKEVETVIPLDVKEVPT